MQQDIRLRVCAISRTIHKLEYLYSQMCNSGRVMQYMGILFLACWDHVSHFFIVFLLTQIELQLVTYDETWCSFTNLCSQLIIFICNSCIKLPRVLCNCPLLLLHFFIPFPTVSLLHILHTFPPSLHPFSPSLLLPFSLTLLQCPYDGCPWRFATPYKLRRHIKSHTKETPFRVRKDTFMMTQWSMHFCSLQVEEFISNCQA